MFVIVDGRLQVVRNMDGKDHVLAERGPGDFLGEMAIIESAAALCNVAYPKRSSCACNRR